MVNNQVTNKKLLSENSDNFNYIIERSNLTYMYGLLKLKYSDIKSKSFEEQANIFNKEFNRADITGLILFNYSEPTIQDDIIDTQLTLNNIGYEF